MSQEIMQDSQIPPDHPCLEGHFPGNPLVPGTLILEKVINAITRQWPDAVITEVVNAKFTAPLRAGETYRMQITRQAETLLFECSKGGKPLANGRFATRFGG